ncbi:hypothetical protein EDF57_101897 [Novosphingobium sp. PhB55]|nr:hypothetical protein EDF57_101897 [Novosphingobium sp. PhB55]
MATIALPLQAPLQATSLSAEGMVDRCSRRGAAWDITYERMCAALGSLLLVWASVKKAVRRDDLLGDDADAGSGSVKLTKRRCIRWACKRCRRLCVGWCAQGTFRDAVLPPLRESEIADQFRKSPPSIFQSAIALGNAVAGDFANHASGSIRVHREICDARALQLSLNDCSTGIDELIKSPFGSFVHCPDEAEVRFATSSRTTQKPTFLPPLVMFNRVSNRSTPTPILLGPSRPHMS